MIKRREPEIIIDEIRSTSRLNYPDNVSITDSLLDAHWCEEQDLILAYEILEKSELDIVIVFLQLPYEVRLPAKWIKIKSDAGNPRIHFRAVGTSLNTLSASEGFKVSPRYKYGATEEFTNAFLPDDLYGLLIRAQILISFQLWGKRLTGSDQYHRYQSTLSDIDAFMNEKLYPAKGVYSLRPLRAFTYEVEVAEELFKQTIKILKDFIPIYAVSSSDPFARVPEYLSNYFIMLKPGRLVVRGPGKSTIAQHVKPWKFRDHTHNFTALKKRMESKRPPSIYEQYLLEAARQSELGACNEAVLSG